ncbi:MAG TPA: DUF4386 domain-containing protein [Candidatus Limnocylindrales bacterium]|nr:DUF4386 domain-containing protein [Candidatus Limnocylindrales bacterium]
MQSTIQARPGPDQYRTTARVVGVLFLAAFFAYGGGSAVLATVLDAPNYLSNLAANTGQLRIGALLMLVNSLVVAAIGVLMLRIARPHGEVIAFGYLAARLVEAVVLAVGVVFLLLQIPLGREAAEAGAAGAPSLQVLSSLSIQGNDSAYQVAMIALGLGSVPFWYLFYRSGLVPRFLAAWGIVGYAIFASGAVLEILGLEVGLILSVPAGLFEASIGIWLIVKGFSSPVAASRTSPASASMAVAS